MQSQELLPLISDTQDLISVVIYYITFNCWFIAWFPGNGDKDQSMSL